MIWNKLNKKMIPKKEWIWDDSNPEVKKPSLELDINNIQQEDIEFISKMVSYIDACLDGKSEEYKIVDGVAITGIQVGYKKRVTYVNFIDNETNKRVKYLLANPKVLKESNIISYLPEGEACLSVLQEHKGIVPRKFEIQFEYFDLIDFKTKTKTESGYAAIVLQHEFDHMDGKLFYDRINIFDPNFIGSNWKKI